MRPDQRRGRRFSITSGGLSTKIAGMVFWGMVLVGLLAAMATLQVLKHEREARYTESAQLLAQRIAVSLQRHPAAALLQANRNHFEVLARHWQKLGFEAVELSDGHDVLRFGHRQAGQFVITQPLPLGSPVAGHPAPHVRLTVYFVNADRAMDLQRDNLMLAIGLVVIAFGIVLQYFLHNLLSKPFASMVASAQRFGDGDTSSRIDEELNDEFGFLAKFINRALNSLMGKQEDLHAALAALGREKELAEVTLQSITDAVITANASGIVQYINPAAERLTGWKRQEANGIPLETVIPLVQESTGNMLPNPGQLCLRNNQMRAATRDAALLRRDGEKVVVEIAAAPMHNSQGVVIGVVVAFQDVSQAHRLTQQLSYQATHDALTGLNNRSQFEKVLADVLATTAVDDQTHVLLYLDLDQFKIVNDTCGHIAGDELLRQIAQVMQGAIRKEDTLARLGGDEFAILLRSCPLDQAKQIADKLHQRIQGHRFIWQNKTFQVGASIGMVEITRDELDLPSILSAADLSCYAAKDAGRNRIHVYERSDAILAERRGEMHWVNEIVESLNEDRFLLYRQSIRSISSSDAWALGHHEILIRMRGRDGSIIMPDRFIPAAERYNLMPRIDRWVISKTFAAMARGDLDVPGEQRARIFAINLSGTSLNDELLLDFIRSSGAALGIDFKEVCFEITETAAIRNLAKASQLIKELRGLGCRFALDDFGSGLSSFSYLKTLPVDYIKIDGSFVKDIVNDPIDRGMVEAVHQISRIMKIRTIAEWVQDEASIRILEEIGIDFAQGFHIEEPRPVKLTRAATEVPRQACA